MTLPETTLRKVTRRLVPFLFLLYITAYIDRVNVSFAQLQMQTDLRFSATVYGLGSGIFFLGYFFFEVPSNLILEQVGARRWIARIMFTWGIISSCMMFTRSAASFYTLRFLLGLAEAGFFPGMILYLTYWIPARRRAHTVAGFMTATTLAGVVGNPISGFILQHLSGVAGLHGWQWLFLLEGIPSVLLAFVVLYYLTDRPEQAEWLLPEERAWLVERMEAEHAHRRSRHDLTLLQALSNGRVFLLSALYFSLVIASYGTSFWLPLVLKARGGWSPETLGFVTAIPPLVAAVLMVLVGRHSDERQERRWHIALSAVGGAIGLVIAARVGSPWLTVAALALATAGPSCMLGPFWSLPTSFLTGTAAAGGIAAINSIGNLGGFAGPYIMGFLKDRTGGYTGGLEVLAAWLVAAALLALAVRHDPTLEHPPEPEPSLAPSTEGFAT